MPVDECLCMKKIVCTLVINKNIFYYLILWQEPKKLVRYRDNKIVSIKGERYTEVKKEDEEEKKNSVSLKCSRQYRFH